MATHLGQRKLLLTEVLYLIDHCHLSKNILYIGAAPAIHIPFLSELFPKNIFYLFDPKPIKIHETSQIIINQKYFSVESVNHLNNDFIIISDIRSEINIKMLPQEIDSIIEKDMRLQEEWINLLSPKSALLKFRLPKSLSTFVYLGGKLLTQPWAPIDTFESRLIWNHEPMCEYNLQEYMIMMNNEKLARFTTIHHNIPLKRAHGLDYCYDCNREVNIWIKYLNWTGKEKTNTNIINFINKTSNKTKKYLTKRPHGLFK